jgi:hypothetical protein
VRALAVLLALALVQPAMAQDKPAPKKKPAAKQAAHKKATPEQIRKFNELEKKKRQ